ncbi:ABC transporter substrate-binding protein [Azospirillum sp. B4]|uniref:ABC transporter substrate-binding protein n=1 Tax=Azospirillum sp. B4 TaxID=95605 RepID=UPI000348F44F|nr:extracellular solute-binding protein [Azospirillum sp. B4]
MSTDAPHYRALTWDHPRGYNALAAAAAAVDPARDGLTLTWDRHSLEDFEKHPIADLCRRYDLIVLDHPHVGDAVAGQGLVPLEQLFGADEIVAWGQDVIGPCLSSYRYAGRHWALPLDAATQVMAYRPDLIDGPVPVTWDQVVALAGRCPVALSLAGPHAALSFQSICVALGEPPAEADPERFIGQETGTAALDLMARLAATSPAAVADLNPIGILGRMASGDDVALCPLIYGYVNYTRAEAGGHPLRFGDAPRRAPGGRPGSTLGGTGIGITARAQVTPALLDHLRWLMSAGAQAGFIPDHDGQPSLRSAWADAGVNDHWGGFYRDTAATLEAAFVRPRHPGAIPFQTAASALIRSALTDSRPHGAVIDDLQDLYAASRQPGPAGQGER